VTRSRPMATLVSNLRVHGAIKRSLLFRASLQIFLGARRS